MTLYLFLKPLVFFAGVEKATATTTTATVAAAKDIKKFMLYFNKHLFRRE